MSTTLPVSIAVRRTGRWPDPSLRQYQSAVSKWMRCARRRTTSWTVSRTPAARAPSVPQLPHARVRREQVHAGLRLGIQPAQLLDQGVGVLHLRVGLSWEADDEGGGAEDAVGGDVGCDVEDLGAEKEGYSRTLSDRCAPRRGFRRVQRPARDLFCGCGRAGSARRPPAAAAGVLEGGGVPIGAPLDRVSRSGVI